MGMNARNVVYCRRCVVRIATVGPAGKDPGSKAKRSRARAR